MEKKKETENRVTEDFIMRPTVDFCFKELMQNERDNGYYYDNVEKRKYGRNDCEYDRCKFGNSERNRKKDFSNCINGKNT